MKLSQKGRRSKIVLWTRTKLVKFRTIKWSVACWTHVGSCSGSKGHNLLSHSSACEDEDVKHFRGYGWDCMNLCFLWSLATSKSTDNLQVIVPPCTTTWNNSLRQENFDHSRIWMFYLSLKEGEMWNQLFQKYVICDCCKQLKSSLGCNCIWLRKSWIKQKRPT